MFFGEPTMLGIYLGVPEFALSTELMHGSVRDAKDVGHLLRIFGSRFISGVRTR